MSEHKCRHCGEDIRSVRLWLPRPPDWPGGILTPPPFDVAYESLEDGSRTCQRISDLGFNVQVALLMQGISSEEPLPHQPMPRIRT